MTKQTHGNSCSPAPSSPRTVSQCFLYLEVIFSRLVWGEKNNICEYSSVYTRCSSLVLFVSFIPLVSSGTDDERCEARLPTRECRAGQWKHQQRETMSHDCAVNALFLFFPHTLLMTHLLHYIWNSCFVCLYVNPFEFNSFWFSLDLPSSLVLYGSCVLTS